MDQNRTWWKNALIYQIYPLSFKDSNGDGIGDIPGIISELDYIKDLGVDVIWLSPIYLSPMADNGYDISDYYKINPMFGTLSDVKRLLKEAHKRGLRVIMDLVVNHTSDQHIWFKHARQSLDNPYRDYYIWRDQPNDIASVFSGSAWTYDEKTKQYYFHLFASQQPDLNWDNPKLRHEIYQMINYWLDLGIDGFRLDVIDLIGKSIDDKRLADGPFLNERLKELKETCFEGRDIMTVGEMPGINIHRAKEITDEKNGFLNMTFQFAHVGLDEIPGQGKWALKKLNVKQLKQTFAQTQTEFKNGGWNSLFWSNHDQPRAVSRYGNDLKPYRKKSAQMLFTVLYSMKGTPFVYQGEEIGMTGIKFKDISSYKDIETINMYNDAIKQGKKIPEIMKSIYAKGRDNSRTPFQWNDKLNAGFGSDKPWLDVNPNYTYLNSVEDRVDSRGVFPYVKKFFQLRKKLPVFEKGNFELLLPNDSYLFAYTRSDDSDTILIVGNFDKKQHIYDLSKFRDYTPLLCNSSPIDFTKKTKISAYFAGVFKRK